MTFFLSGLICDVVIVGSVARDVGHGHGSVIEPIEPLAVSASLKSTAL
jgi:hypothetical protein